MYKFKILLLFFAFSGCGPNAEKTASQAGVQISSVESAFVARGYKGLNHYTNIDSFSDILASKALEPRLNPNLALWAESKNNVVYLGAYKHLEETHNILEENIYLLFPLKLLERDDYHLNLEWIFGDFIKGQSFYSKDVEKFFKAKARDSYNRRMEIVFRKDIKISDLQGIICHKNKEEVVKNILAKYNFNIPITTF